MEFDMERIRRAVKMAVSKSHSAVDPEYLAEKAVKRINFCLYETEQETTTTDEIRQLVEEYLMQTDTDVATAYIEYRHQQDIQRKGMTDVMVSVTKVMKKDSTVVNENANKDSDRFNVERDLTSGSLYKAVGLKMLPKKVANAHMKGDLHFHDLDYHPYAPMTNCCLIDFKGMMEQGFAIGNAEVETPKSIQTAVAQVSQIIANVSSNQYGGCSFDRADEALAPYAEKNYQKYLDEASSFNIPNPESYAMAKTKKDIYDSMQSLEYEVNTLYNANGRILAVL